MQESWIAVCSADLQIGVDRFDVCQDAHLEMGNRPRQLVFHAAGKKLTGGTTDLEAIDPEMHAYVLDGHAEYLHAPERWQPGTVSQWDAFKSLKESELTD